MIKMGVFLYINKPKYLACFLQLLLAFGKKGVILLSNINSLFNAKSVAILGASTNPKKLGHVIFKNIIEGGYSGKVYPVSKKGGHCLGYEIYTSLKEIKESPELLVVVVPSNQVVQAIEEAGECGVKAAIIISGGFRESNNEELEKSLLETAKKHLIRILGPNCQGLTYTPNDLCASWPIINKKGNIAIISQSGTVAAEIGLQAVKDGLGVSGIVSLGNKSDVGELDLIEFFNEDANTRSIALYIEGVSGGEGFIEVVKKTNPHKPVIILKPGRTKEAQKASMSHTKSIAGKSEVFDGLCKQYGFVNVKNVTELYDYSKGFSCLKKVGGKNVLIVTSSGGSGILATDECSEAGLNLMSLQQEIEEKIKAGLGQHCSVKNPIDLTGDATAAIYEQVVKDSAEDPNVDIILVIFGDPLEDVGNAMIRLDQKIKDKLVICFLGGGELQEIETHKMHGAGIPVFPSPERAVSFIKKLVEYSEFYRG